MILIIVAFRKSVNQKSLQNEKKSVDKFAKSNYIIITVCEMQTKQKGAL
nr:MAG TPA: hypothetical protein [Caudoviricetes sp.]